MTMQQAHQLAAEFVRDDVISMGLSPRGVSVAFHDAADRRTVADRTTSGALTGAVDGWAFNQINAMVSQTGTVNGVDVDLYSKADADDWRRFHEVNGPLTPGGAA
jgi:hypothetical protein